MMANAGLQVQSYTELLDQEFWEQVPDENKKEVLTSDEAWCVPPRNVRAYLDDMLRRGELKTVNEILMKYATCVGLENPEARRHHRIRLSGPRRALWRGDGSALMDGIRRLGNQLRHRTRARIADVDQRGVCAPDQEAASKRCYAAMQQALFFGQRRASGRESTQSLRPRIGAEERILILWKKRFRSVTSRTAWWKSWRDAKDHAALCHQIASGIVDSAKIANSMGGKRASSGEDATGSPHRNTANRSASEAPETVGADAAFAGSVRKSFRVRFVTMATHRARRTVATSSAAGGTQNSTACHAIRFSRIMIRR